MLHDAKVSEYEVASSPASEHSLQATLVQGYLATCPLIFF